MARVAFSCTLGSLLQDSGRVLTQDAELAPSAELLEARVAEDMTGRSLPDIDDYVLAQRGMFTQIDPYGRRVVDFEWRRALGSLRCALGREGDQCSSPAGGDVTHPLCPPLSEARRAAP